VSHSSGAAAADERRPVEGVPRVETVLAGDGDAGRNRRARRLSALGALVAGLVSFGIGELTYDLIPAARVRPDPSVGEKNMLATTETIRTATSQNAAIALGVLGLCSGACLGWAGGWSRRSRSAAIRSGLLGAILALLAGASISLAALPPLLKVRIYHEEYASLISLVSHGLPWGMMGAAAGLAFAYGLGERRFLVHAAVACFLAGIVAAILFDLTGVIFFPTANTEAPISSSWLTRLIAGLLAPAATVLALAVSLPRSSVAPARPAETAIPSTNS
jgi:hypothetical protein